MKTIMKKYTIWHLINLFKISDSNEQTSVRILWRERQGQ